MKIEFNKEEVLVLLDAVLYLLEDCGLGEMEYIDPLLDMEKKLNANLKLITKNKQL